MWLVVGWFDYGTTQMGKIYQVNDTMIMSIVQRQEELDRETPHDTVRNHMVPEPGSEASECLSHNPKNKADMPSIWAMMFE
jgi:hypothetical protein